MHLVDNTHFFFHKHSCLREQYAIAQPRSRRTTRAIILENDDERRERQAAMHERLRRLGFRLAVCAAQPWWRGDDPYYHRCFWSVLLRGHDSEPIRVSRGGLQERVPRSAREPIESFSGRVDAAVLEALRHR